MSDIYQPPIPECFICGDQRPPFIQSSRVEGLRNASRVRDDGLSDRLEENAEHFICHRNCIQTYCSTDHVQRLIRKRQAHVPETDAKRLRGGVRGSDEIFKFKEHCFFCGEQCLVNVDRKHPKRWRKAFLCRTGTEAWKKTSRQEIVKHCRERGDAWGMEVEMRVNAALSDLHAEDGRYHKDCYAKFYSNEPCRETTGDSDRALDLILKHMRADKTRIWNSVELHNLYIQFGGSKQSRRTLMNSVYEHLTPELLILYSPGVASMLVFRSKASKDLCILDDAENDCISQAISCLADTIKAECPKPDRYSYKTRLSKQEVLGDCSPTLLAFLTALADGLDSTLPAAMIGNIITSVVSRQTTSLQIALSVLLSRHRKVIDELHAYGVTSNYDELRRFRISVASQMASVQERLSLFDSKKGLVQVVADNFDTKISSQNGHKATHGLAMILTQANKHQTKQTNDELSTVKRLKVNELRADRLDLGDVVVQRYKGERKPCMPEDHSHKAVQSLVFLATQQVSLNRVATEDLSFFKRITSEDPCPEYGGYNTQQARETKQESAAKTAVVYTPFLDMPPAEPDTMKTAMVEAQRLTSQTGQKWTVFTNDQQLYQVAVHITWVDRDLFRDFVPRLGGMHMLMSFVGCIGYLMEGSGLEQILETTFAGVPKLLSGKNYPQNVRALRLLVEELLRPLLGSPEINNMTDLTEVLAKRSTQSKTTKLWVECLIEAVFIMMVFVRAEREADWPLHLLAVEKMMPFFFAASHFNYARYGLYYLRSMQRLHPELAKRFMAGEHVMRHEAGLWNGLWSDLFIETTYMRYGHGPSGIIGSTLNESTLAVWAYSHSTLTQIMHDLQEMKEGKESKATVISHKEEQSTRLKEDAADRNQIREALSTCLDVFDTSEHPENGLINIYSGHIVDEPAVNVHNAVEIGAAQCKTFESQWPAGFHNKLRKNIKPMSSVTKRYSKDRTVTHRMDTEFIYARVLAIMVSSRDNISLETLFSHELAPHPTALFDDNGDLRTTNKSVLKNKLQILPPGTCDQKPPTVIILDACAVLWTVPWPAPPAKVSDFVTAAIAVILRHADTTHVLHVVFDRYHKLSTKSSCRLARQKGICRAYTLTEDAPLPKQALVLNVTTNKAQVIRMIVDRMSAMQSPKDKRIIITGPDLFPEHMGVGPLQTAVHHEEADVSMAYHMIQEATTGQLSIKVVSDDTDVLVILAHHLYFRTNGIPQELVLTMGSCSASTSFISINEIVRGHKKIMPNLLCAHALTGCDTVSSFAGIGKSTVLKKMQSFNGYMKLGDLEAQKDEVIESCLSFTAMLYNQENRDINNMRADIFKAKIAGKRHASPKLCSLPPTMSSLEAHCLRAHHQVSLWKAAGLPTTPEISPLNCGWELCGSTLTPQHGLQRQVPAPDEVMNLISCGCKTGCSTAMCTCTKMSLTCTMFCKCKGKFQCKNPMTAAAACTEEDDAILA